MGGWEGGGGGEVGEEEGGEAGGGEIHVWVLWWCCRVDGYVIDG